MNQLDHKLQSIISFLKPEYLVCAKCGEAVDNDDITLAEHEVSHFDHIASLAGLEVASELTLQF